MQQNRETVGNFELFPNTISQDPQDLSLKCFAIWQDELSLQVCVELATGKNQVTIEDLANLTKGKSLEPERTVNFAEEIIDLEVALINKIIGYTSPRRKGGQS